MQDTYDTDFYAWANTQAELLRTGQLEKADIAHIAEEIESMGKSELRELENRLALLFSHLLKWQLQPTLRSRSWELTIKDPIGNPAPGVGETAIASVRAAPFP